jgi:hypothetical protein
METDMLLTNYKSYPKEKFLDYFESAIESAISVRIASGYVGQDTFIDQISSLKNVLEKGGSVELIFGISFWEGVTKKCEEAMREFHHFASGFNKESGIFIVKTRKYHGKIYCFGYSDSKKDIGTVGSSNFSSSGFGSWSETNIVVDDPNQLCELQSFFDRLKSNDTVPITLVRQFGSDKKVRLTDREKDQKHVSNFTWPAENAYSIEEANTLPVAFQLPLRTGSSFEKSSLNLFNGPGRKNTTGRYKIRGWYEVENTIRKDDPCRLQLNKYLPAQIDPFRFNVVTDEGQVFQVNFKRKHGKRGDIGTLRELGVDFQSSNRRLLGYFIKDRLVNAGVLDIGETITPDMLDDYGSHELIFRDLGGGYFYMTFG